METNSLPLRNRLDYLSGASGGQFRGLSPEEQDRYYAGAPITSPNYWRLVDAVQDGSVSNDELKALTDEVAEHTTGTIPFDMQKLAASALHEKVTAARKVY